MKIQMMILFLSFFLMSCAKTELKLSLTPKLSGSMLDPSRIFFLNDYYLIQNLSVRLLEMDTTSGYRLMLASSVEKISDLEYHFKIKETYFSNGDKVTLIDVKNSFLRSMKNQSSHIHLDKIIKEIAIENDTLKIFLNNKTNDFLYFLTLADVSVLHSSQLKDEIKADDWKFATSGAFFYEIVNGKSYLLRNRHFKLAPSDYPDRIELAPVKGKDSFEEFQNGRADFGEFNLNSFSKHSDSIAKTSNLKIIGNVGDSISLLALNVDNSKFSNEYNRKWIQKKIMMNYGLDPKFQTISRKAFQYYTPAVKGFVKEQTIQDEVKSWNDINIDVIPESLKDGFVVKTYERAFEVVIESEVKKISDILGIPVKVENDVPSKDYNSVISKRDFEAFLIVTSMDQVIVGESINLYYFSSAPVFKDVNGLIKKTFDKFQNADSEDEVPLLNNIAIQMIRDSECIPLFYVASPFYYNIDKLDVSRLDEVSFYSLWNIKEK